jgi:hypothetical protein
MEFLKNYPSQYVDKTLVELIALEVLESYDNGENTPGAMLESNDVWLWVVAMLKNLIDERIFDRNNDAKEVVLRLHKYYEFSITQDKRAVCEALNINESQYGPGLDINKRDWDPTAHDWIGELIILQQKTTPYLISEIDPRHIEQTSIALLSIVAFLGVTLISMYEAFEIDDHEDIGFLTAVVKKTMTALNERVIDSKDAAFLQEIAARCEVFFGCLFASGISRHLIDSQGS